MTAPDKNAVLPKEEQNLVEFPLVLLSDHVPDGRKTIQFVDSIWDKEAKERLERKVSVSTTDDSRLPNWMDMDVLLALMVLTWRKTGFRERKLEFSLYELRELLGWPKKGDYTKRIKESLDRWNAVRVKHEKSWRRGGKWVSFDAMHIIDNVRLTNTPKHFDPDESQHILWNDEIVRSFQEKNTKPFDWEFYRSLKKPITKRLYRFLCKRFHQRQAWTYDLVPFCVNKLGMKEGQRATDYRRKLWVGIEELMNRGVLAKRTQDAVVSRVSKGRFDIEFKQSRGVATEVATNVRIEQEPAEPSDTLETELIKLGVQRGQKTATSAGSLVAKYSDEKIRRCISHYRSQVGRGVGYLIASITAEAERGYVPDDFKTRKELEAARRKKERAAAKKRAEERAEFEANKQRQRKAEERFFEIRGSMSEERACQLEDEALSDCDNTFIVDYVRKARRAGEVGSWHQMLWETQIYPKLGKASE